MSHVPPASTVLSEQNIPHKIFVHNKPIRSIELAAAERNQDVSQIIRSIVFRLKADQYAMVLIAGKKQISWKALREHFGMSRLTMASPEEVLEITGYEIGTVSPFGLKHSIPILADKNVFSQTAVSLGSGRYGTAILMLTKDLKEALGEIETGNFATL